MINIRGNTPNHLLRETEHKKPWLKRESYELLDYLFSIAPGGTFDYLVDDPYAGWGPFLELVKKEWPYGGTSYCKVGERDPFLGYGVTAHRFKEFLEILIKGISKAKIADLILTGHKHRSIEYSIRLEDQEIRYFHDYYIDNSLHGQSPQQYWKTNPLKKQMFETGHYLVGNVPNYTVPLNKTKSPKGWWHQHKPLFVQTLSLGPKPSEQPEGGALLITVQNDVITNMKRVYLSDMKKEKPTPTPIPAYFILSTSPP